MPEAEEGDLVERMRADLATLPDLPWMVATSNSYRRIMQPHGQDGGVLQAYVQRSDGHPDLSMSEAKLEALVRIINAVPGLLATLLRAEADRDEARKETIQQVLEFLEAGAKGAAENIHDAELGRKIAAAILQQVALMRALFCDPQRLSRASHMGQANG